MVSSAPPGKLARKGTRDYQECRGPLASRENPVLLVLSALWATLGPQAWRVPQDKRVQRGPRDPKVPVETLDPQVPQVPR